MIDLLFFLTFFLLGTVTGFAIGQVLAKELFP